MELLELFWLLWLDGWTGEHWATVVWTGSTVGVVVCGVVLWAMDRHDGRKI